MNKMHDAEVDIDVELVRQLLVGQFPQWSDLPVEPVHSTGTVNAIYRLGEDMCIRFPRVAGWDGDLVKELQWLPQLAPRLTLDVPEPISTGVPGPGYAFPWAIYRWIDGVPFAVDLVESEHHAATDLAQFITELRHIDTSGAPRSSRDTPLHQRHVQAHDAIGLLADTIDADAASAAWTTALQAPPWDGVPRWTHGDLLAPNLLVKHRRLHAVLDFGNIGVGDPAVDVIAAWSVFGREGRESFRQALDVDDGSWARARGFALHQALLIIPYYIETNSGFVATATRTIREIVADHDV